MYHPGKQKKSGNNEYNRYVPEFYAINKSGCTKYLSCQTCPSVFGNSNDKLMFTFNFFNANGKRFISKAAKVYTKPWWVRVKVTEKDSSGKDVTRLRDMQAGYVSRRGEQQKAQVTFLAPMGEKQKPNPEVALAYIVSNG